MEPVRSSRQHEVETETKRAPLISQSCECTSQANPFIIDPLE